MIKKLLCLVFALALLVPAAAMADTFTVSSYSVTLNTVDPGLVLNWAPALATPYSFNLNPGQSTGWFNLFDLWTNETAVNLGEDTVPKPISVTMNFSQPIASGTVGGSTYGVYGVIQGGHVTWSAPVVVPFGNGGSFTMYLQDADFNMGVLGVNEGQKYGADIYAKIKYNNSPSTVPEPGMLFLLSSSLVGLNGYLRKKKAS
ncbi:MAG TPA: hypothetical protein VG892_09820 [Terriglobales bacterium]|nr:hypothetical protein [Terriglobales bacterium]